MDYADREMPHADVNAPDALLDQLVADAAIPPTEDEGEQCLAALESRRGILH